MVKKILTALGIDLTIFCEFSLLASSEYSECLG